MIIKSLDWDSKFFGMKVGRIDCMKPVSHMKILNEIKKNEEFDLVYVFSSEKILQTGIDSKLKLVDEKIKYTIVLNESQLDLPQHPKFNLSLFRKSKPTKEMESLAYQSGEFSRFKTDTSFEPSVFFLLYKEWINNSISGILADAILVASINDKITGLLTMKFESAHSSIGLFAVDENYRGMGMGNALMSFCSKYTQEKGLNTIFVDTQAANLQACSFYEKFGFQIYFRTFIYHHWKKNHDPL